MATLDIAQNADARHHPKKLMREHPDGKPVTVHTNGRDTFQKKLCLSAVISLLLLVSCASPRTVSRTEFDRLKTQRNEPKVSQWYYVGSRDGFHYFHHDDLGHDEKDFRISETELLWRDTFPFTRRRKKWHRVI
jgi:hypothetical protein